MINSIMIRPTVQNKSKCVRNMAIRLEIQLHPQVKYAPQSIFTKLTITQLMFANISCRFEVRIAIEERDLFL